MVSIPIVLIPARIESSRFPAKALAPMEGIPMVIRCAQNSLNAGLRSVICTDSELISDTASKYNIESILTPEFNTGTDRIHYAASLLDSDLIINLQGDEPLISSGAIGEFSAKLQTLSADNHRVILNGLSELDQKYAFDPNNVKAVVNDANEVIYLSRKPIRNTNDIKEMPVYLKQLGLYGFTKSILAEFAGLPQPRVEKTESIEMMRWLNKREIISGIILDTPSISVDTPEDLLLAISKLSRTV